MSGKGDDPRPLSVPQEQFNANWDAIDWNAREREQRAAQARDAAFFGHTDRDGPLDLHAMTP